MKTYVKALFSSTDLLLKVSIFSTLTQEQAGLLGNSVVRKSYKRGDFILEQGQKSNTLSILLRGRARVVMAHSDAREVILATLQPGDYFGEMSLIDGLAHSASVVAEIASQVLVLERRDFMRCIDSNSDLSLAVMQGLVARLRIANQKISALALTSVDTRVAYALLELAQPDAQGRRIIREKISRMYIAQMVGASREMVSRVLKVFEKNGFIHVFEDGSTQVNERRNVSR
jgi:CRP-like cAMP-binding protein